MFHLILNNQENSVSFLEYSKNYFIFYIYLLFIFTTKYFVSDNTYYDRIYNLIRLGGPIFIKIGQNLANKNNTNPNLKSKLMKLQNENFYDNSYNMKLLKINYGIDKIDDKPIASGSIAAIFKGTYKNKKCVIKIIHQNIVNNTIISINIFESLRNKIIGNDIFHND